ncbi:N-acetylneuraminate synthase [Clostridium vincentii]|uniref:N,N'-diacetyllegionaminic acid synthase n=1 Tax=Clostridium vincentii TaxID=52704 RepID=A0A2T0BG63_9CLOT|nr:N-acetylneuraminate synthase [Clostridium vincentii]PRR82848.1 N,N'-diacetyllegionaminic acid synthase [Clostridium vincentii]
MSVFIVAEAGVNHNGSIDIAKKMIDEAAKMGVDAIKFQTFITEKIASVYAKQAKYQSENTRIKETQFEMLKKLELSQSEFKELKIYCDNKEIVFLSTAADNDSVDFLVDIGVKAIKLGSGEVTNLKLIEYVSKKGIPIILSTGMSNLGEVEKALNVIDSNGNCDITLLHATTNYPTDYKEANIRAMVTLKDAFKRNVGYSDHTIGVEAAIIATTLGATIIEKHFTLDSKMEGPDHRASLNVEEFKNYIKSIRNTEILIGNGIKRPTVSEISIMNNVRRSIVARRDLKTGDIITENDIEYKRPGTGIYPEFFSIILGRKIKKDIKKDQVIVWDDI